MQTRAENIETAVGAPIEAAEGRLDGEKEFSRAMPHGCYGSEPNTVMMTRIKDDGLVFVHTSDIQLIEPELSILSP